MDVNDSHESKFHEPLTGVNYKKWKQDLEIVLGVMDMDLALRTEELPMPNKGCTLSQRSKHEKWENSNIISLMIIKRSMTDVVCGGFPEATNSKEFMKSIEEKYKEYERTKTGNLMNSLTTIRYDGEWGICEYTLKVIDIAGKLRTLEVLISKTFLVHVIMNSLPISYTQLNVSYDTLQRKWDVNELITICVGEEVRIKKERAEKETGSCQRFEAKVAYWDAPYANQWHEGSNYSSMGMVYPLTGVRSLNLPWALRASR
ncbi:uncharacterized protein [Malus domestica]|uniref:uncharacterized protein n=1 Tax=Malus domestica TaxID=3750 RepID=UPI0039768C81